MITHMEFKVNVHTDMFMYVHIHKVPLIEGRSNVGLIAVIST